MSGYLLDAAWSAGHSSGTNYLVAVAETAKIGPLCFGKEGTPVLLVPDG
jgi:hypothetical protein